MTSFAIHEASSPVLSVTFPLANAPSSSHLSSHHPSPRSLLPPPCDTFFIRLLGLHSGLALLFPETPLLSLHYWFLPHPQLLQATLLQLLVLLFLLIAYPHFPKGLLLAHGFRYCLFADDSQVSSVFLQLRPLNSRLVYLPVRSTFPSGCLLHISNLKQISDYHLQPPPATVYSNLINGNSINSNTQLLRPKSMESSLNSCSNSLNHPQRSPGSLPWPQTGLPTSASPRTSRGSSYLSGSCPPSLLTCQP